MLKCKILKSINPTTHWQSCVACQNQAQQDARREALISRLLTARANDLHQQTFAPAPDFMQKLAARLHAEPDSYLAGLVNWEQAIPSLRGWVVTFSAAALLLIALAAPLVLTPTNAEEEIFTANAVESGSNNAFWLGE